MKFGICTSFIETLSWLLSTMLFKESCHCPSCVKAIGTACTITATRPIHPADSRQLKPKKDERPSVCYLHGLDCANCRPFCCKIEFAISHACNVHEEGFCVARQKQCTYTSPSLPSTVPGRNEDSKHNQGVLLASATREDRSPLRKGFVEFSTSCLVRNVEMAIR